MTKHTKIALAVVALGAIGYVVYRRYGTSTVTATGAVDATASGIGKGVASLGSSLGSFLDSLGKSAGMTATTTGAGGFVAGSGVVASTAPQDGPITSPSQLP